MVGGSVNGMPFRDDPNSYGQTGLQCGNPNRYRSKSVVRMTPYGRPARLPEGVANQENPETEGERQLKFLLTQQMDKNLTIQEQFLRHRSFQPSSSYVPITKELSGQLSSSDFKNYESHKNDVDQLRQMGLDDGEVMLKIQHDGPQQSKVENRFGAEPSILKQQLEAIQAKMETKKKELSKLNTFRAVKHLSRHEMDLEKSLKPTSHQTELLRNLVTLKPSNVAVHPLDPANSLKDMEQELLERVKTVHQEKKRKMYVPRRNSNDNPVQVNESHDAGDAPVRHFDEKVVNERGDAGDVPVRPLDEKTATATDALLLLASTVFDSKNPVVTTYVVPISEEEIENNRLSLDEIRQIPRFKDYKPGVPSKVLYLKNLAHDVCQTDLIALFARFQRDTENMLQYRLLNGKMRGQAFVTFPEQGLAAEALHMINGFKWKGKPIIIQYGHQDVVGN